MNSREKVIKAHRALLNGSGELSYFAERGISEEVIRGAYLGYEPGSFLYPCRDRSGRVLGLHYKSKDRDAKVSADSGGKDTQTTFRRRDTARSPETRPRSYRLAWKP